MKQSDSRPNPDDLLARVKAADIKGKRGRLKIFLGYAPGVGKTYAMLEVARQRKNERDVVIGYVETHGRKDTDALLEGFEIIPRQQMSYRGILVPEMDLDAVLARHPELAIVDEYAHSNAPGSRHAKRYQDIEELLDAGIDVYTTLNIQHIESLRNIIAQITDVWVRETIPDSAVDTATDIELIDISPDELTKRLKEGKVYLADQAASAIEQFFRKGNLTALRELAMRTAARRVDEQMRAYMEEKAIPGPWPSGERLLVWLDPDTASPNLIRNARRFAGQLDAEWFVIEVETPGKINIAPEKQEAMTDAIRLAEKLGARKVTVQGMTVPQAITKYAREHNISKIIVGQQSEKRWQEKLRGLVINRIIEENRNLDVYIIRCKPEPGQSEKRHETLVNRRVREYILAVALLVAATGLCALLQNYFDLANLVMIYLLCTVITAVFLGLGPSILVAIAGVLIFDVLFVPPYLSFAIHDIRFVFSLAALLIVGIVISYLTAQFRKQTRAAWERERQTAALYSLGRDLAVANDLESYINAVLKRTRETFENEAIIFLADPENKQILKPYPSSTEVKVDENDSAAALWAFQHQKSIGFGTDTLPNSRARYFPLVTARGTVGVIALMQNNKKAVLTLTQERLMEAYTDLAAVAIEGILLTQETRKTELLKASEKLQNALLNSISHDLRTPLVSIIGALSSLEEDKINLDNSAKQSLIQNARDEAERLNRLITNLLDESRLEAGAIKMDRQPAEVQDLIGSALEQLGQRTIDHQVKIEIPEELSFVNVDFTLTVQVLVNILDNAFKYSPPGSQIEIRANRSGALVIIEIADRGIGVPVQDLERIFDKFYRVHRPENVTGTGLGLSIAKGIIESQGGRIAAENRAGGGTTIRFSLPVADSAANK